GQFDDLKQNLSETRQGFAAIKSSSGFSGRMQATGRGLFGLGQRLPAMAAQASLAGVTAGTGTVGSVATLLTGALAMLTVGLVPLAVAGAVEAPHLALRAATASTRGVAQRLEASATAQAVSARAR